MSVRMNCHRQIEHLLESSWVCVFFLNFKIKHNRLSFTHMLLKEAYQLVELQFFMTLEYF